MYTVSCEKWDGHNFEKSLLDVEKNITLCKSDRSISHNFDCTLYSLVSALVKE